MIKWLMYNLDTRHELTALHPQNLLSRRYILFSVAIIASFISIEFDAFASERSSSSSQITYATIQVDGLDIFYREAGEENKHTIVLLHGFPTSSHMFRNLIPALAEHYHVVAPDYPGFGNSSMPLVTEFNYTFDRLAEIIESFLDAKSINAFSVYVMDYGAPVGFRIASKHPDRIEAIIVQNGNAYSEGLKDFWDPIKAYWKDRTDKNTNALKKLLTIDATKWQYTHGIRDESAISPDNWYLDQVFLDRPGNQEIQLELFYDYGSNLTRYPEWQAYFRQHQPPMLIVWGENDYIFPADGAYPYKRDIKDVQLHFLDTGHFALEEDHKTISAHIHTFLKQRIN